MEDTIANYLNLGKIDLFLPNYHSRKIRVSDLGFSLEGHTHTSGQGIASYTYLGDLGDAIVDPGIGNCGTTSEADDYFDMQLVLSTTDKNGMDIYWPAMMTFLLFGMLEYCTVTLYVHSKSDPKLYMGLYVFNLDVLGDDDEYPVSLVFNVYPMMMSVTYDAEADEYHSVNIPDNDEVVISWDFSFNPDYLGSMGTQDYDSVSISGGTISTPVNIYRAEGVPDVDPGWASSSTIDMNAPDGYASFHTEEGVPVVVPYWIKAGV